MSDSRPGPWIGPDLEPLAPRPGQWATVDRRALPSRLGDDDLVRSARAGFPARAAQGHGFLWLDLGEKTISYVPVGALDTFLTAEDDRAARELVLAACDAATEDRVAVIVFEPDIEICWSLLIDANGDIVAIQPGIDGPNTD